MAEEILAIRGLRKRYKKDYVLKGIEMDIPEAEITGVIGPDGAGKSTFLKICSGILSYEGSVRYRGRELFREAERLKPLISFMPQGIGQNLYADLTVEENLHFIATLRGLDPEEYIPESEKLLLATGLHDHRHKRVSQLSGGMKQKLGLCSALLSRPELMILDEPTTGIDPLSRHQLWNILLLYRRRWNTTILYGTSYMEEAERCFNLLFMHHGEPLYSGTPERLLTEEGSSLEEAFLRRLTSAGPPEALPVPEVSPRREGGGISVKGLTKTFKGSVAVDNVNLFIKPSEVFGLLGPNGAGKTTLIKCILGLLRPDKGEIEVAGMEPGSRPLKYRTGYMSQIFSLYSDLTVKENILLYGSIYGIRGELLRQRMEWVLGLGDLYRYRDSMVKTLPAGIKQRLALGCAILHLPDVLFLDEPTAGVDPLTRRLFWDFIKRLSKEIGVTVLVTTHNLIEADFCDRVGIMDNGRMIRVDTPDALREEFTTKQGEVYEVFPDRELPVERLRSLGLTAVPFGRRYLIYRRFLTESELRRVLKGEGIDLKFLKRIPPPIELIFLHLLRERQ